MQLSAERFNKSLLYFLLIAQEDHPEMGLNLSILKLHRPKNCTTTKRILLLLFEYILKMNRKPKKMLKC